jgi:ATP-dependent RNA helicase RhlB
LFKKLFKNTDTSLPEQPTAESSASPSTSDKSTQAAVDKQSPVKKAKPKRSPKPRNSNSKPAKTNAAWDVSQFPVPEIEGKVRFHDLNLEPEIMHAVADLGFEYCSPIQAQSLPDTLKGLDLLGKAQTGTGKTAAFLIAIIDDFLKNPITDNRYAGEARALIIAPTRELVLQIADDARNLTKYTDLTVHTLVGGMDYDKQKRKIDNQLIDILVATPGRLLDFSSRKHIFLDQVEVMVLDEADRMLDMGFIPQVRRIVRATPPRDNRQTLFFSATFTEDVMRLAEQWTRDPINVEIEPDNVATDTVTQYVYLTSTEEKLTVLCNIARQQESDCLIVFANRRDECRRLHKQLERQGFKVGLLSGEIQQSKRVKTLDAFKAGRIQILVATDVAGRGIHIDDISHVVNYTLPEEPEDYVHRIGRTGRAGKDGVSISFACEDDAFRIPAIEKLLGKPIHCEQPPEALLKPL